MTPDPSATDQSHADIGPTFIKGATISLRAPNDGLARFEEDATLLASIGIRRLRIGFDWATLQPRPGGLDDDWCEALGVVIDAASAVGIGIVAGLNDGPLPGWFVDDGGFGDAKHAGRWWPRWVEAVAETFGDRLAGWVPMNRPLLLAKPWADDPKRYVEALTITAAAWRDAWRILRGGPPVATDLSLRVVRAVDQTIPAAEAARREDHLRWRMWLRGLRDGVVAFPDGPERRIEELGSSLDVLGFSTTCDIPLTGQLDNEALERWEHRLGTMLRRLAEDGPDRPLAITLHVLHPDDDDRRIILEWSARTIAEARRDGIALHEAYIDPAIDHRPGSREGGLLDRDRDLKASASVWLSNTPSGGSTPRDDLGLRSA